MDLRIHRALHAVSSQSVILVPIPAMAIMTIDISPLLCLYSACPHECRSRTCTDCASASFFYTYRFGPSISVILQFFGGILKVSWIHSWTSYAVMFGLVGSNVHTTAFRRSAMLRLRSSPSHTHSHRVFSLRTRSLDCLSLSVQEDHFTYLLHGAESFLRS